MLIGKFILHSARKAELGSRIAELPNNSVLPENVVRINFQSVSHLSHCISDKCVCIKALPYHHNSCPNSAMHKTL